MDGCLSVLSAPVLAHQGGWDEMLFVTVPVLAFVALQKRARRRNAPPAADDRTERDGPDTPERG